MVYNVKKTGFGSGSYEQRMSEKGECIHPRKYLRRALLKPVIYVVRAKMSGVAAIDAETLNISTGGACIVTDRGQKPGSIIRIRLPLLGTDIQVPRLAEVRWLAQANDKYKMGLEFRV
jgi:c-di-GMP-binding flagellar brake protein YcgR